MSLFFGVHEVRVKTAEGIFAGYFTDEQATLSAVEKLPGYIVAWHTLNPLLPDVLTADTVINPANLERGVSRGTERAHCFPRVAVPGLRCAPS